MHWHRENDNKSFAFFGYTITHNISKIDSYPVKSDNNQDKNLVRFFFSNLVKSDPLLLQSPPL